jgi:ADP-ribosylglycohydrolase
MEELREGLQSEGGYCAGTTLAALSAFMESHDFVSAIQNAISLGGDPSTTACITGSIAEAFYKEIPQELIDFVKSKLPEEMITTLEGTSPDYTAYCTEDEIPLIQERVSQQLQGV